MIEDKKEEKKRIDVADWVKLIGYVAAILVASTSLLSASGYIPPWWFGFSLIFLIGLILSVPVMVFAQPISEGISDLRIGRRQNSVACRYFNEFEALVEKSRRASYPLSNLWNLMKQHYQNQHKSQSGTFPTRIIENMESNSSELQNRFHGLAKSLEGFDGSMRDLSLLIDEFNRSIDDIERQVRMLSVYASEMKLTETSPQILKQFEEFREQYNLFVNDYGGYCHRINQEVGKYTFLEIFNAVKKW